MTLKELKVFVNSIPEDMDHFEAVNGEFCLDKDGNTFIMKNNSMQTAPNGSTPPNSTEATGWLYQTASGIWRQI